MAKSNYDPMQEDENPLDFVEDVAEANGWAFTRHEDEMITVIVKGQKNEYEVHMEWQDEFSALLFACSMPIEVAPENFHLALRALEQINQNMWMGHFDLSNKNIFPTYRYTLLCRMVPPGMTIDILNDVFDIAISECNRFYTTFQLVQAGDDRLQDNLQAAIFETIGEA